MAKAARRQSASLLNVRSKKKVAVRTPKLVDEKYTGGEPSFIGSDTWDRARINAMIEHGRRYYNYHSSVKDLRKNVVEYATKVLKFDKNKQSILKSVPDNRIPMALCSITKMANAGAPLELASKTWIKTKIESLLNLKVEKEVEVTAPKINIQDRIRAKTGSLIAELDGMIDDFTRNGYNLEFNAYNFLKANGVTAVAAKKIAEYYEPLETELAEVVRGKDADLNEGYSHLKKVESKRFYEFVSAIRRDAMSFNDTAKKVRTVRKKKPMSVDKKLQRFKYLKEDTNLKIASINPSDIIGAVEIWLFNTKYRRLTHLIAESPNGLDVKGTTIIGFSADSKVKSVRKPEVMLPKVMNGGKRVVSKVMDEINTKESEANGRVNSDTIILRAFK